GPTLTRGPLPGSPVIERGSNAALMALMPPPTTDQRGLNRIVGTTVNIGAVEYQPPATTTALAASATSVLVTLPVTVTATVTATGPTGRVPWLRGGAVVGTAAVRPGATAGTAQATFSATGLAQGNNVFTASYDPDGNVFDPSMTPAPLTVQGVMPTTTALAV